MGIRDEVATCLPVRIRRVAVHDVAVGWSDEGWSLNLLCPWTATGPSGGFSWESDSLEDDAWELVGHDLVDVEVGDDLVDPTFRFSGGWSLTVEADSDLDPWVLRLPGLVLVGRARGGRVSDG